VRRVAIVAFPIAISFALQVSGIAGTKAEIVAWSVVGVVGVGLVGELIWRRSREEEVAPAATCLGRELVGFIQQRRAMSPPTRESTVTRPQLLRLFRRGRSPKTKAERAYDADTMTLYQERFADRVIAVVQNLRSAGRLGAGEAQELVPPRRPASVEELGRRLIELGFAASPSGTS
jgi:hypothetical protein